MVISIDPDCKLCYMLTIVSSSSLTKNQIKLKTNKEKFMNFGSDWLDDNKLSVHLGKTECILFGSKRKLTEVKDFNIVCNCHTIASKTCVKYGSLNTDNFLTGELVVNNILTRVNARLQFRYKHLQEQEKVCNQS